MDILGQPRCYVSVQVRKEVSTRVGTIAHRSKVLKQVGVVLEIFAVQKGKIQGRWKLLLAGKATSQVLIQGL